MVNRALLFAHRWLGVVLCPLFLLWFVSGIGMLYADYPVVSDDDRVMRSPPLDAASVRLSPAEAFRTLQSGEPPRAVRLDTFDGRPVYRFEVGRGERIVYADTGDRQAEVTPEMMRRIAARWTGQPAASASVSAIHEVDQWTVQAPLRTLRPLWKFSWADGEQVYVAQGSGDVVQYTTTSSRLAAYLGPIPHWLYFTPIRRRPVFWSTLVTWTAGLATVAAILGLAIGWWVYSPEKRYLYRGAPTRIPYRGQKRWHMVCGLIAGVAAVTWAFSGMLSMDPFSAPADGGADDKAVRSLTTALREPLTLDTLSVMPARRALLGLEGVGVKELELVSLAGEPYYLATLATGGTRVVAADGQPRLAFDLQTLVDAVAKSAGPNGVTWRVSDQYDAYYFDRRAYAVDRHVIGAAPRRMRPLPVLVASFRDRGLTRVYIDPKTARVAGRYSTNDWTSRWAYHGLHSLAFPGLYERRPLWDIVVLALLIGGAALCSTAIVLAGRVVRGRAAGS